jgi:N6-adenosine-specific RNA methylase IME4
MTTLADRKSLLEKIPPFPARPKGGFPLIYCDCPWTYRDKANSGDRGASHKYPVLSVHELKALRPEVQNAAADNCALLTWATAPMMDEAREVMAAWGFKYSTIAITWIKTYNVAERLRSVAKELGVTFEALVSALAEAELIVMKPRIGMGNFTRSNAEFLLIGTQGKVVRANAGVPSVVVTETREHSRKPDEVRGMLEKLFGDMRRLEMFSRATVPGWDSWGLEAGVFDDPETPAAAPDEELWPLPDDDALGGLDAAAKANPEYFKTNDWDDARPAV